MVQLAFREELIEWRGELNSGQVDLRRPDANPCLIVLAYLDSATDLARVKVL